ncbi:MAG: hypothetical protein CAF45_003365 [Nitrospira sp. CG24E]|nr:MAG: hypothetical protein CAF45_003365 [Nitrospira sp. CG24E]
MSAPRRLAVLLWILLFAFCLRVVGQMLVAFVGVSWLPPMEAWYSGLLPYPYLLPSQLLIIALYSKVCLDFTRGEGFFVRSRPLFGRGLLVFGYLYLASMILRYIVQMILYPEARWFGGAIPIVFHWVLASFIIAFGQYHRGRLTNLPRPS